MAEVDLNTLVKAAVLLRRRMREANKATLEAIGDAVNGANREETKWSVIHPSGDNRRGVARTVTIKHTVGLDLDLVIHDGGKVRFPAICNTEPYIAANAAEALHKIAEHYALLDEPEEVNTGPSFFIIGR